MLLAAAGLLIRTLIHLETMPPGFNPTGVITAKASLDDVRYHDPAAFRKLLNESLAAMREIPGVQNAAVGLTLPYERALLNCGHLQRRQGGRTQITTNEVYVTPGYFETLQIPVLAGRAFTDADGPNAQPVVIVNQTFARKFFHQRNPVGRYLNKEQSVDRRRRGGHRAVLRLPIERGHGAARRGRRPSIFPPHKSSMPNFFPWYISGFSQAGLSEPPARLKV